MPLDYIRITKDQMVQNERKRQAADSDEELPETFEKPEHLKLKRSDTEKVKMQKKKKLKALKY